jgi:hypothetical protein
VPRRDIMNGSANQRALSVRYAKLEIYVPIRRKKSGQCQMDYIVDGSVDKIYVTANIATHEDEQG